MANIANLITKLSGIIASLDDIRDAISQGGGGSSTASGVSVTPTSPLTGTNLQATTNETAALLQEHTDDISALNSSLGTKVSTNIEIVNDYPTGTQPKFFRANSPFGVAPYVPAGACGLFIPRSSQDAYLIAMTLDLKMVMVLKNNGAWGTPRFI